jgi:hypothetical protein
MAAVIAIVYVIFFKLSKGEGKTRKSSKEGCAEQSKWRFTDVEKELQF